MDEVKEDKLSSILLGIIAFVTFLSGNLALYQGQAAGFMALLPVPEQYKPALTLLGAGVIGGIAYWNFKTPAKREEAAYQTGLYQEVPQDTVVTSEGEDAGDTA